MAVAEGSRVAVSPEEEDLYSALSDNIVQYRKNVEILLSIVGDMGGHHGTVVQCEIYIVLPRQFETQMDVVWRHGSRIK